MNLLAAAVAAKNDGEEGKDKADSEDEKKDGDEDDDA